MKKGIVTPSTEISLCYCEPMHKSVGVFMHKMHMIWENETKGERVGTEKLVKKKSATISIYVQAWRH